VAAILAAMTLAMSAQMWARENEHRRIKHVVVIYQENWSFDSLYGLFPGANGISNSSQTALDQIDRLTGNTYTSQFGQPFDLVSGSLSLTTPPQPINNGAIDTRFPAGFNTIIPYDVVEDAGLQVTDKTGDIVHRFWHEQSQINHGKMNLFMSWSDNPGLVISYFDATNLPVGLLAQKYTLCDNFFHAAFGGSFLNHQFLVAAAAPVYPNAPATMQATLDASGQLSLDPTTGKIVHDGNITPIGGASFVTPWRKFDKNYAVNTIFSTNLATPNTDPAAGAICLPKMIAIPTTDCVPSFQTLGTASAQDT
jgi:phospholipase C